jgi:hypothetical protein
VKRSNSVQFVNSELGEESQIISFGAFMKLNSQRSFVSLKMTMKAALAFLEGARRAAELFANSTRSLFRQLAEPA